MQDYNVFVINLDSATERWKYYENKGWNRWAATHYNDLDDEHPIFKQMVSMWNIPPEEHKAKCACYISHTSLWEHIIKNDLKNVLVLEDDAYQINELPNIDDLPNDSLTYFGGITYNKRLTDGPLPVDLDEGLNKIDYTQYRMIMLLSYFIPNRRVAYKMLQSAKERGRPRAIDVMVKFSHINHYLYYPAIFVEKPMQSQIRNKKVRFSDSQYNSVKSQDVCQEIKFYEEEKNKL
jgi:hypothetical protein